MASDTLKQTGKLLGKTKKDSDFTIRRVDELFPLVERKVDFFDEITPMILEFKTAHDKNNVLVTFIFKERFSVCCGVAMEVPEGDGGGSGVPTPPPVPEPPIPPPLYTYYISSTGDDSTGDGSTGNPWKTIDKFLDVAVAGDALYCRGGTYTSTPLSSKGSALAGTAAASIVIKAYPGETPIFDGGGAANGFLNIGWGSTYVIIDGLQVQNFYPSSSGIIQIGGTSSTSSNITIKNCRLTGKPTGSQGDHGIYIPSYANNILIDNNLIIGPYPSQADASTGSGIAILSSPAATNIVIQRNIITNWSEGIQIGDADITAQLLHNTFLDNRRHIAATSHTTLLVRDNAGDSAVATDFEDGNPANTTADHNYWAQNFDSNYYLLPGQSGRGAASDGTDAGALNTSAPLNAYYISPTGSDSTGAGTLTSPWATIQKFINTNPSPGDTLYCRGGTYTDPPASYAGHGNGVLLGTEFSPITIRNYPGETPIFSGEQGWGMVLGFAPGGTSDNQPGSQYVIVDGLRFEGQTVDESGTIYIGTMGGQAGSSYVNCSHITIRNCYFSLTSSSTSTGHAVYISKYSEYILIENCEFEGPYSVSGAGFGIHAYSGTVNGPRNITVRYNIIHGWQHPNGGGMTFWDNAATGSITHNTFVSNDGDIIAEHHGTLLIRDNAFDSPSGSASIHDPNDYALTTSDHNFFSQSFDSSFYLLPGQTGRGAASDGTDAGAKTY